MKTGWHPVAGIDVYERLQAEKELSVPKSETVPGCYQSDHLCAWQSSLHTKGYEGARIVDSMYGYSVRYDSGLNDFAILASSRYKDVDGSYEDALRWATAWQAKDPERRYVTFYHEPKAAA